MATRLQLAFAAALGALALAASPAAAIVNGTTAGSSSWPWAVQVLFVDGSEFKGSCGGTLVAPRRVVTTGTCTTLEGDPLVMANTKQLADPAGQLLEVTNVERAPSFAAFTASDVAVLTLTGEPAPAVPIEVLRPGESADFPAPSPALVAGWGVTDASSTDQSEVLRQGQVTLAACGEAWARCSTTTTEPCFGDLGGPTIVQLGPDTVSKDPSPANGTWRLVAIPLGGSFDCTEVTYLDLTQPSVREFVMGSAPEGGAGDNSPAPAPPSSPASTPPPPSTKLVKARIDRDKGTASFRFKGGGELTGFQCALASKARKKAKFKPCRSPKRFRGLAAGTYSFKVRAVGPGGPDATPAVKRFTIH